LYKKEFRGKAIVKLKAGTTSIDYIQYGAKLPTSEAYNRVNIDQDESDGC
jgi:hypothetical protein